MDQNASIQTSLSAMGIHGRFPTPSLIILLFSLGMVASILPLLLEYTYAHDAVYIVIVVSLFISLTDLLSRKNNPTRLILHMAPYWFFLSIYPVFQEEWLLFFGFLILIWHMISSHLRERAGHEFWIACISMYSYLSLAVSLFITVMPLRVHFEPFVYTVQHLQSLVDFRLALALLVVCACLLFGFVKMIRHELPHYDPWEARTSSLEEPSEGGPALRMLYFLFDPFVVIINAAVKLAYNVGYFTIYVLWAAVTMITWWIKESMFVLAEVFETTTVLRALLVFATFMIMTGSFNLFHWSAARFVDYVLVPDVFAFAPAMNVAWSVFVYCLTLVVLWVLFVQMSLIGIVPVAVSNELGSTAELLGCVLAGLGCALICNYLLALSAFLLEVPILDNYLGIGVFAYVYGAVISAICCVLVSKRSKAST